MSTTGTDSNDGLSLGTAWSTIDRGQPTRINGNHLAGAVQLTVYDTEGFPAGGTLKIEAETIAYGSKDATHFNLSAPLASDHNNLVLVFDNDFSGGDGFDGGDVIEVQAGTYYQQVDIPDAGVSDASRITYRANGKVVVDGQGVRTCAFNLFRSSYITLEGFNMTGGAGAGLWLNERMAFMYNIRNCSIYANYGNGISGSLNYDSRVTQVHRIDNCNIVGNAGAAYDGHVSAAGFRDCNIVANRFGLYWKYSGTYGIAYISNCCFYANGVNIYTVEYPAVRDSEDDINGLEFAGWSANNIVADPCFADFHNGNFDRFFSNSPCLGAATDGGNIGPYQSPEIVALSNRTFYVATTGDDSSSTPTSHSSPWRTITKAVAVACAGDTVVIEEGSYPGGITVTNSGAKDAPIKLEADGNVRIEASGSDYGLRFKRTTGVVVDGFRFNNATVAGVCFDDFSYGNSLQNAVSSNSEFGVFATYSGGNLLDSCLLTTNAQYGLYSTNAFLHANNTMFCYNGVSGLNMYNVYGFRMTNCAVYANVVDGIYMIYTCFNSFSHSEIFDNGRHGACHYNGSLGYIPNVMDSCRVHDNVGVGVTASIIYSYWLVLNSNIYSNGSHGLSVGTNSRDLDVQNCTVYGNGGSGIWNGHYLAASRQNIVNNIFFENQRYGVEELNAASSAKIDCNYNLFYNNTMGNYYDLDTASVKNSAAEINSVVGCANNLVDPPGLKPDLRLYPESACVNAGTGDTNLLEQAADHDIVGTVRPAGGGVDIGAYEFPDTAGSVFVFN